MLNFANCRPPQSRRRPSCSISSGSAAAIESLDVRLLPSAAIFPQEAPRPQAAPANFNGLWKGTPSSFSMIINHPDGSKKATIDFTLQGIPDAKAKIKGNTMTIKGEGEVRYTIILTLQDSVNATGTYSERKPAGTPRPVSIAKIVGSI